MKRIVRILGVVGAVCLVFAGAGLAYLALRQPDMRPPSPEKIAATPARVARGRYLAEHVAGCVDCHSDAYFDRFSVPAKPGTFGQGGFAFDSKLGVPGVVQAQNITSDPATGLGAWTDGEILRAIREGVDRHGVALFPQMPYTSFRTMSDEDARSIVVYVRTLPAIRNSVAPRRLDFPVNLLIKGVPKPLTGPVAAPSRSDSVAYGGYLVTIAGCRECHTAHDDHGAPIPGTEFGGGWEMSGPWGRNVTANITPDPATWMGKASREDFLGRFRAFASFDPENAPLAPKGRNTVMPWIEFAGMADEDLSAIYDYLKTVKPIARVVESFPDAPAGKAAPSGRRDRDRDARTETTVRTADGEVVTDTPDRKDGGPDAGKEPADLPFPDSLCHVCAAPPKYVRTNRSTFVFCPLFRRYPPQPVRECSKFVPLPRQDD